MVGHHAQLLIISDYKISFFIFIFVDVFKSVLLLLYCETQKTLNTRNILGIYCFVRKKPIRQATAVISLWFSLAGSCVIGHNPINIPKIIISGDQYINSTYNSHATSLQLRIG